MSKTLAVATLALSLTGLSLTGLSLTGSAALAGEHSASRITAGAPQPIAEVTAAGGGTTTGTVAKMAATWFTLTDGRDRIDVTTKGFLPEGLQTGQQVTVTGGMRQGAIRASQIVREDGAAFGRGTDRRDQEGRERHHERHQESHRENGRESGRSGN